MAKIISTSTPQPTTSRILDQSITLYKEGEKAARQFFGSSKASSNFSAYNARTNCGRRNGNCDFVIGGDLDERERKKSRKEEKEPNWKRTAGLLT